MDKVVLKGNRKRKEDIGSWTYGWTLAVVITGILIMLLVGGVYGVYTSDTSAEITGLKDNNRIPDVRNLSIKEAGKVLERKGLEVEIKEEFSKVIPEGYVVEQNLKPGKVVEEGKTISLIVSSGKKVMPDIHEFVLEDAKVLLDRMEIEYEVVEEENEEIAPGAVIFQSIKPNEQIGEHRVLLKVATDTSQEKSDKTSEVKDLTGYLYDEAKKELREQGIYIAKYRWEYCDSLPMGSIVSQRVTKGSEIGNGEVVAVAVNVGFTQATVPDVTGREAEEAITILKKIGMPVTLTYENSTEVPADSIIEQDILLEEIKVGTNITLCVSLGKKKQVIDWTEDTKLLNNPNYNCETKTEYRYQTRTKTMETTTSTSSSLGGWTMTGSSQVLGNWGAWSGWSENSPSGSDTRQVESREVLKHGSSYDYYINEYRYRDRSIETIYDYQREVYTDWSDWSVWQQEVIGADDCTNVEMRILYKYTEK